MVGLSVVLESQKKATSSSLSRKNPQVINKVTMTKTISPCSSPSSTLVPAFLAKCCLCKKKLLPDKDIYMYKGDRAFCSVECRCRQIFMDEENQTAAIMYSSNNNKSNVYSVRMTTNCSSSASSYTNTTRNPAFEFAG